MDRSRSRPSEVWRTDHPSDRQGGPIPRDRSSLHKQDVFNDFEAYELKLAVSRLSLDDRRPAPGEPPEIEAAFFLEHRRF